MDEVIALLQQMADTAYIEYSNINRTDPCLGEAIKLEKGLFGDRELACHRRASVHLGRHQAFSDAIRLLRSTNSGEGKS
jgi:hypothetical protein